MDTGGGVAGRKDGSATRQQETGASRLAHLRDDLEAPLRGGARCLALVGRGLLGLRSSGAHADAIGRLRSKHVVFVLSWAVSCPRPRNLRDPGWHVDPLPGSVNAVRGIEARVLEVSQ